MAVRIADLMTDAAARSFVGRNRELALLSGAVRGDGRPAVLFVHGPGGIGKSRLLDAAEASCWADAHPVRLDCASIEPTPAGFLTALGAELGSSESNPTIDSVVGEFAHISDAAVLSLDTYESFGLLDSWLRREFVPQLPDRVLVVLTGRERPSPMWLLAPWGQLVQRVELGPLPEGDALAMLESRGLDPSAATHVHAFARGYPLAAELAAAAHPSGGELELGDDPPAAVMDDLVRIFMRGIDGDLRLAIEAASLMRRVTQPALAGVLDGDETNSLFDQLRELAFVDVRPSGLVLHAVVRDAVSAELRQRDPERHALLRQRAAQVFASRSTRVGTRGRWDQTADLLYLVDNPVVRHCYFPPDSGASEVDRATPDDREFIQAIATKWDGPESAEWFERWWAASPGLFSVLRDDAGDPVAFTAIADPALAEGSVLSSDAIGAACLEDMERHSVGPNERVLIIRRSLSRDGGETPGRELAGLWIDCKRLYLELRPQLKRAYIVFADVDAMAPMLAPLGFNRIDGKFEVAGKDFGVLALDFGPRSVDGWLEHLIDVELAAATTTPGEPEPEPTDLDSLSDREREVLRLVADGLSNREIADHLVISERTAARHVANIFLKLGVHSRAHAARLAAESGMTRTPQTTWAPPTT